MGFYDFSKKQYIINAALGKNTSRLTRISKKYPKKTFFRNYFKHMRRSIYQFATLIYSSNDKRARKFISLNKEESKAFVDLAALYFTIAMTSRKENMQLLKNINISRPALLGELYNQLEFDSEERTLGKRLLKQSELNFSTFTVNWCNIFSEKVLQVEESALSQSENEELLSIIHGSFLFFMRAFT
ncbi:MAG: hypothetical protein JJE29_04420 [Peptostreptococcaceae bacterium]|nr:hypothetical protein [Peptostreptococcaceae bacterium]